MPKTRTNPVETPALEAQRSERDRAKAADNDAAASDALAAIQTGFSPPRCKIDKSTLALGEPKRQRSNQHLRYVGRQSCLICGRAPSHAHHIRYAQSRGLGLKVSDEFTVPLCAIHHSENHATGDERKWWEKHGVDPLPVARNLWSETHTAEPE